MNQPELTQQALSILRSGENFQWYVIPLLALVIYVYTNEISKKNWKGIAAGLSLYLVHWFYEIANALIQYGSGHALWTVPAGTSFLILIGVGIELSLMFSVAGLVISKILPEDPKLKILGVNNRIFFAVVNAALFSIIEIFLAKTPAFHWVYPWWGHCRSSLRSIFLFLWFHFCATTGNRKCRRSFIGALFFVDALMMIVFAGALKWI